MKTLVENFSKQLAEAIEIGNNAKLSISENKISNVLICGLGGSGIGGSIVHDLVAKNATASIEVVKGYFIPNYVNENTLVIISSYSGNTEETVQCFNLAIEKKAKIVCVTSGGKVEQISKDKNIDCILVPGGMPPRACLGYSLTQLFFILGFNKIISFDYKKDLENTIKLLDTEEARIFAEAKILAEKLVGKIPVIYTTTYNEGIAVRFRQQLNENSKSLCWHQVIPEMNHNELVGWTEKNDNLSVVMLLDQDEYERNVTRIEMNKEVIKKYAEITEVYSKGESDIEKAFYLIHLCDWVSVILAELKGVDMMDIKVINDLKSKLSEKK